MQLVHISEEQPEYFKHWHENKNIKSSRHSALTCTKLPTDVCILQTVWSDEAAR